MRIGFVTQWFPPEPGTLVAAAIAGGLAERGHQVDVLTGFPNYPSGKLHEGFPLRPYRMDEVSPRITVHRAPLYPSHDGSPVRRVANYLSFAAAASWVARRHVPQPDAWLVYSSPATAAMPAILGALGTATPIHLLIEDLWPDSVTESGMMPSRANRWVGAALHRYCSWTYGRAAGIGVISPSMGGVLAARGVEPARIHYTPNWVDFASAPPGSQTRQQVRDALGLPLGRLFMYAGNMGELQGLEPLVRAFSSVPGAHLVLIGAGVARARLERVVSSEQIANVLFLDPRPTAEIGRYVAASDVQVVSLQDTALLRATMPSKVQNSLAAGRPVLVHAAGDVAELVSTNRVGAACRPGDHAATVSAIRKLAAMSDSELGVMGSRARRLYESEFSAAAGLDRLEVLLRSGTTDVRSVKDDKPVGPLHPVLAARKVKVNGAAQHMTTAEVRYQEDNT